MPTFPSNFWRNSRLSRAPAWLSPTLLTIAMMLVSGCHGNPHVYDWGLHWHHDGDGGTSSQPPRPPANAASESLVQASGAAQEDPSGLIENSAIIGEPFAVGLESTVGTTEIRHGFTPPIPPGWPTGIAQAAPGIDADNHLN